MEYLFLAVIGAFGLLTCMALYHQLVLRRSIGLLQKELAVLRKYTGHSANAHGDLSEPWVRMIVEVKNPIALAERESGLAKMASGTAPNLVVKKVYEQVMAQTKDQLKSKNVEADVSLIVL